MLVSNKNVNIPAFESFRTHEYFKNLKKEEFDEIAKHVFLREYKADHYLFDEGDRMDRFFVLVEGVVRLERLDPTGDFYFYDYIFTKNAFPSEGLCCRTTYNFSCVAVTKVIIYYFPIEILEKILRNNPSQCLYTVNVLTRIIQDYELRIQNLSTKNAHDRVEQSLFYLRDHVSAKLDNRTSKVAIPITINELSLNASTTRETVRQVLKELIDIGAVKYENKTLFFLDNKGY
ncbi:MAG: Crp/Fnr family transcriptional regulator [Clostridiales Family XIII bacterium]|jgi:CRP-like cAMP-binding protein|nr:Crp/Fnr family transcriptional regulator [Clostridiales Family XIII bacterium]